VVREGLPAELWGDAEAIGVALVHLRPPRERLRLEAEEAAVPAGGPRAVVERVREDGLLDLLVAWNSGRSSSGR
jgi:hypothetical protein